MHQFEWPQTDFRLQLLQLIPGGRRQFPFSVHFSLENLLHIRAHPFSNEADEARLVDVELL